MVGKALLFVERHVAILVEEELHLGRVNLADGAQLLAQVGGGVGELDVQKDDGVSPLDADVVLSRGVLGHGGDGALRAGRSSGSRGAPPPLEANRNDYRKKLPLGYGAESGLYLIRSTAQMISEVSFI